jgi:structural maintenance of chromosome 1
MQLTAASAKNDEIERLASERFAIYRRCKLEEIDLPLESGSFENVPIDEAIAAPTRMDVDGEENETQNAMIVEDYGVVVDFSELAEEEKQVQPSLTALPLLMCLWFS